MMKLPYPDEWDKWHVAHEPMRKLESVHGQLSLRQNA